ncbi:hypothetical protein [Planctomicrobium piriforme]|uniref:Heparinase II/III-like protein n=1 Tax=Planctomicrobium piriforme TaxID=1576369 RepID=A0A1I3FST6_9PLAN|nr:hypothetical protein [Planctomicrobium piriforme]SFI14265.1 hypothetical protein SAMN05421753_10613 [Planctomicrobium piriforme]
MSAAPSLATSTAPVSAHAAANDAANDKTDQAWLQSLQFRSTAPVELSSAAAAGDLATFSQTLLACHAGQPRVGKRERRDILNRLQDLWGVQKSGTSQVNVASLAHCLFETELNSEELSGRVEAIMASTVSGAPDDETLMAALWLLRLIPHRLECETLFSLWRWTVEGSRTRLHAAALPEPDQGCAAFDALEIQCAAGSMFGFLKGELKQSQHAIRGLRKALDAATDSDGALHGRWLDQALPRLCQLARVQMFSTLYEQTLWNGKARKRIEKLFAKTISLLSPGRLAFSSIPLASACRSLLTAAAGLDITVEPTLLRLLKNWELGQVKSIRPLHQKALRKELGKESHQSDWSEWGSLRSSWSAPVDQCLIRHSGAMPAIEVIAGDVPFLAGAWSHELMVAGSVVPVEGEWACCCWYLDRESAYMELQLKGDSPIQIIRQALLLREESVLLLADSVRLPESQPIRFTRTTPLAGDWRVEDDAATREFALLKDDQRVRVFPWTCPQYRLDRSAETVSVANGKLRVTTEGEAKGVFSATLFDWSPKRREEPVDWQRATVAEDGQILPPEVAAGYRLRLGKKQWILYHSLQKPTIPRTVLGIHSASETVFAKLDDAGDALAMVEVEL